MKSLCSFRITMSTLLSAALTLVSACVASEATPWEVRLDDASAARAVEGRTVGLSAMAPLVIGRLTNPDDPAYEHEWTAFGSDLEEAKALGIDAISFDVWWGVVEREGDQRFDWAWVDRVVQAIADAGLRVRPVLAFHACGGNVGDDCLVSLPPWLGERYLGQTDAQTGFTLQRVDDLFYESAQGRVSREAVSVWATPLVLQQYSEFAGAFAERYASRATFSGIAVGLGSASELRYPSYNAHDDHAGYPGPGVLQAYSPLAVASFRVSMLAKYGDARAVARAWGHSFTAAESIYPPNPAETERWFAANEHVDTRYGRDFFDWYHDSLLRHGALILREIDRVVGASSLEGTRLTARIPGVHWRAADTRRAELAAGLIATSQVDQWDDDDRGHGYADIVGMIALLRAPPVAADVTLDYTALEMGNGEGGPAVGSMAEALVFWIADEAHRRGVPIGAENALQGGLWTDHGWSRINNALRWSHYEDLTFLRLGDVIRSPVARAALARLGARAQ